jgi:hypothetical protein
MAEPTMRDMTQAAAFISGNCQPAFSPVEATHALSWLIAKLRADERAACAKICNEAYLEAHTADEAAGALVCVERIRATERRGDTSSPPQGEP